MIIIQKLNYKNLAPVITASIILAVCIGLWSGLAPTPSVEVKSEGGVWDLRGVDFSSKTAWLYGPVAHIPNALLTPEEFGARENEAVLGFALETNQLATSRVRILALDGRYYTFSRISTDFSDRIFVNGVWLHDVGVPGESKDKSAHFTSRVTFTAKPENGVIEIVQQNSNFVHREGGDPQHWRVGGYAYANSVLRMDYTVNIVLGCYLALFLVFILLYFLLRGYRANLYFALFCLMWFLRSGVTGARAFAALAPWLSGPASLRIEYISLPVAAILSLAIIDELFRGLLQKKFLKAVVSLSAIFALLFLFLDSLIMSYAIVVCEALYLASILYILVRFALKLRRPSADQAYFAAGLLVFMYGGTRDFFFYNGVYILPPFKDVNLTQICMLAFAFCEAAALFISTMNEVEKAKEAEQRLAADNAALDRVNLLKTDLMRTISHEMRTPLAVVMGFAEITAEDARKSGFGGEIAANLDAIAAEAGRMSDMMEEMRQLALAKDYTKNRRPVDPVAVIRRISGLYGKALERKGTALNVRAPDGLPPVFCADSELIQVIFNLLRNADAHSENGVITISAEFADGFVKIAVSDTGTGIAPELLPRVFERGAHGEGGGSGFGLAICKDIITARGGEIDVKSEPGKGAAVTFTLPAFSERSG